MDAAAERTKDESRTLHHEQKNGTESGMEEELWFCFLIEA